MIHLRCERLFRRDNEFRPEVNRGDIRIRYSGSYLVCRCLDAQFRHAAQPLMVSAMIDRMSWIWVPKKVSATRATMTIKETISAYSATLWPL